MNRKNYALRKFCMRMLIGVLSVSGATVWAQSQKPAKKVTLGDLLKKVREESRGSKVSSLQKKSVNVPDSKITFEGRQPVNLNEVKPPKLSEIYSYENSDQGAYERTLEMQIEELYKLTQKFRSSANRGELWLRLAELYVEKANLVDARKQGEYDKKLKEFQTGKTSVKPTLDLADAREYNKKAIQLYDWFLRDFPNDPKVSQALFFLGYNNYELGNVQNGSKYYDRLAKNFPSSPFTGEAHFAMGESYFEGEKWADAYKEYSFLIKDNKHSLHTIALYKASWCLFRLGKTEEAIKYMDFIVKSGRRAQQKESLNGKKVNSIRLENEAIKDLVVFFADVGDSARAIAYFKILGKKESRDSIEKLAYYLSDKGNREASREVFKHLIEEEPTSKKSFEFQYQIVQNYFFSKNSPEFKNELYKWIVNYNIKSTWYSLHKKDQTFVIKSNQLREQTLRNYILQQHQTAQNSRAKFSQQTADEGYRLYFQEFNNSQHAPDMHFFYGELLYDMGRYGDAAVEYTTVVNDSPSSQYAEKASQNILLSIERALPKDDELQKKVGNSVAPLPLDEKTDRFIKTANWYLQRYPKSEKAAEIRFRVGRLYYLTNNFDPAEKQFREIVQQHPKTKFSEYSANLLLDIYSLKKDYVGLEKMGTELLADSSISNTKVGQDIRGVLEKASFKKAQTFEMEKKYAEAATQFQVFAAQNPKSELTGMAYFNAGVNFERAGRNRDAVANYRKVILLPDASAGKLKPKSKRLLAKLYQDGGLFEESGKLYRELVKESPGDSLATNYIYNSALMLELTGKTAESITEYQNYLKVNKNKEENADVLFKIAQLQRKSFKLNEARELFKKYVGLPEAIAEKKVEAYYWICVLSNKQNIVLDTDATMAKIQSLMATLPKEKRESAATYVAKIKLIQSDQIFNKLKSISIPNNPVQQKVAVDRKLEHMNTLNEQLGAIIKLDSAEEIVASLYILGEANEHMAFAFKSVPVPAKLTGEQRKIYMTEVDKVISTFVNKSEESYKLAVERGMDLQVYSESYSGAFAKMNKKYPAQYYYGGEAGAVTNKISWIGDK